MKLLSVRNASDGERVHLPCAGLVRHCFAALVAGLRLKIPIVHSEGLRLDWTWSSDRDGAIPINEESVLRSRTVVRITETRCSDQNLAYSELPCANENESASENA